MGEIQMRFGGRRVLVCQGSTKLKLVGVQVTYSGSQQRVLGAFYTTENPFNLEPFKEWMASAPDCIWLEPFAGSGNIPNMLEEIGVSPKWRLVDIDTNLTGVEHRDSLREFPTGHAVVVSNPPYLSYHFAKRKGLELDKAYFRGYSSLYLVAIEECLRNCEKVALIVPESFMTTGLFRDRLCHFVSLPFKMFGDTEMPVALALFSEESSRDFKIWRGNRFIGWHSQIPGQVENSMYASRFKFNDATGKIGLRAIDDTQRASIMFLHSSLIPEEKVKHSARLLTRVSYQGPESPEEIISMANELLNNWRIATFDIHLTAFKGIREDGMFRRRLDYANARNLLGCAIQQLNGNQKLL